MSAPGLLKTFQTALIWISVLAAFAFLWLVREAVLVAFGAILAALLLSVLAQQISNWTPLPRNWALVGAVILITAVFGATIWLFGSQISGQFLDVVHRVGDAQQTIMQSLKDSGLAQLGEALAGSGTNILSSAMTYFASAAMNLTEGVVVLVISAIYLAAEPKLYRVGLIKMFPIDRHEWARHGFETLGTSLRLWLLGQLILMLVVGVLSLVAALIIGLPSPVALALISGLAEIVPYLGAFIGAIPAVLVAFNLGLAPALWTIVAFLIVHLIEGYLVGPLVQRRFVRIPPALMLIGIMAMGLVFGPTGIIFAAPLTVAIFVAVKLFYVRDTLQEDTEMPGEAEADQEPAHTAPAS